MFIEVVLDGTLTIFLAASRICPHQAQMGTVSHSCDFRVYQDLRRFLFSIPTLGSRVRNPYRVVP
jgi:hypothetical protein